MKTKDVHGKTIYYADSAREMRKMLTTHQTQLLTQPGSAIAICQSYFRNFNIFCDRMRRDENYSFHPNYNNRKFFCTMELEVLVSHRTDNNLFSLVGGARKMCESFEEAAYRELGEETGLELSDLLFLGLVSGGDEMINIYPDGNAAEGVDALFMAIVPPNTITRPNAETQEFLWLNPATIWEKVNEGVWHPAQVKTVLLFLNSLLHLPEILSLTSSQKCVSW